MCCGCVDQANKNEAKNEINLEDMIKAERVI
jgi:hypothetical protein